MYQIAYGYCNALAFPLINFKNKVFVVCNAIFFLAAVKAAVSSMHWTEAQILRGSGG